MASSESAGHLLPHPHHQTRSLSKVRGEPRSGPCSALLSARLRALPRQGASTSQVQTVPSSSKVQVKKIKVCWRELVVVANSSAQHADPGPKAPVAGGSGRPAPPPHRPARASGERVAEGCLSDGEGTGGNALTGASPNTKLPVPLAAPPSRAFSQTQHPHFQPPWDPGPPPGPWTGPSTHAADWAVGI